MGIDAAQLALRCASGRDHSSSSNFRVLNSTTSKALVGANPIHFLNARVASSSSVDGMSLIMFATLVISSTCRQPMVSVRYSISCEVNESRHAMISLVAPLQAASQFPFLKV